MNTRKLAAAGTAAILTAIAIHEAIKPDHIDCDQSDIDIRRAEIDVDVINSYLIPTKNRQLEEDVDLVIHQNELLSISKPALDDCEKKTPNQCDIFNWFVKKNEVPLNASISQLKSTRDSLRVARGKEAEIAKKLETLKEQRPKHCKGYKHR